MAGKDDGPVSGRRGFFRLGLERMRSKVVEAVSAVEAGVEHAHNTANPAPQSPEAAARHALINDNHGRTYHRARVRSAASVEAPRVFRPPGAIAEDKLLEVCTRCGDCAAACPESAIVKAGPALGPNLEMTPIMNVEEAPCFLCTGVPCAAACPSGALLPLEAADIKLGTAVILEELCLHAIDQPCTMCVDACPLPQVALILPVDEEGEAARGGDGALPLPRVDASHCTGCGLCANHCVAYPKAIMISPAERGPIDA